MNTDRQTGRQTQTGRWLYSFQRGMNLSPQGRVLTSGPLEPGQIRFLVTTSSTKTPWAFNVSEVETKMITAMKRLELLPITTGLLPGAEWQRSSYISTVGGGWLSYCLFADQASQTQLLWPAAWKTTDTHIVYVWLCFRNNEVQRVCVCVCERNGASTSFSTA